MSYTKAQKDNSMKSRKQIHKYTQIKWEIKEIEIKKNHAEILELKNPVNEIKKCNGQHQQQNRPSGRKNQWVGE